MTQIFQNYVIVDKKIYIIVLKRSQTLEKSTIEVGILYHVTWVNKVKKRKNLLGFVSKLSLSFSIESMVHGVATLPLVVT